MNKELVKDIYSLSPMQEGMFFHYLYDKRSSVYFEQLTFHIQGPVNLAKLSQSLEMLINKYDVLRTIIASSSQKARQIVLKQRSASVRYRSCEGSSDEQAMLELDKIKQEDRAEGFDLSKDSLLRITAVQQRSDRYYLIISFHHILMDGWCIQLLFDDLFNFYGTLLQGGAVNQTLLQEPYPFKTFIQWLDKQDKERPETYWRTYLRDFESRSIFPRFKKGTGDFEAGAIEEAFSEKETSAIARLAASWETTPNIIFQAIWGAMLQRFTDTADIVYGTTVSGRPSMLPGIEKMVGLFINTVPVRLTFEEHTLFKDVVEQLIQHLNAIKSFEYFELSQIQRTSDLKKNLFDHIFVYENFPVGFENQQGDTYETLGFKIDNIETFEQTNYDLNVIIYPKKETKLVLKFNKKVHDPSFIQHIATIYHGILQALLDQPAISCADLPFKTEEAHARINPHQQNYPFDDNDNIDRYFMQQVEEGADKIAVIFDQEQVTYHKLNEQAERVASYLLHKGVQPGTPVGIMLDRSIGLIASLLGILKAGCSFVPINPTYPKARIVSITESANLNFVITSENYLALVPLNVQSLDSLLALQYEEPADSKPQVKLDDDAYMMFTSGSTGTPKGAINSHLNLLRITKHTSMVSILPQDVILQLANISFDAAVLEIFWAVLNGATLVIPSKADLVQEIKDSGASVLVLSAPLFNTILDEQPGALSNIRTVLTVGEAASVKHVNQAIKLLGPGVVVNGYGPTECSIWTLGHVVNEIDEDRYSIPIGVPTNDTEVFVVNQAGLPQPIGGKGELYIAGRAVGKGYVNEAVGFSSGFQWSPSLNKYIYKTGDLVRALPNGEIEYLGRKDTQLKIRGFRIELEEIERTIAQIEGVKQVAVVAKQANDILLLWAYVVLDERASFNLGQMKDQLKFLLPDYMIPHGWLTMEKLPLNLNGKIDRKALPDLTETREEKNSLAANGYEEKLQQIWCGFFETDDVSPEDSFFDLGGDSIKAIPLSSSMTKAGFDLSVRDIFQFQTIRALTTHLVELHKQQDAERTSPQIVEKEETVTQNVLDELLKSLHRQQMEFPNAFCFQAIRQVFPASGSQIAHLSAPAAIAVIPFEFNESVALVEKAALLLIESQQLLRCKSYQDNMLFEWCEYDMPGKLAIPSLDISGYAPAVKETLYRKLLAQMVQTAYTLPTDLSYAITIIKRSEQDCALVLIMHHSIYDMMSLNIIKNGIFNNLALLKENGREVKQAPLYSSYITQINQGPQHTNPEEVQAAFNLVSYRQWNRIARDILKEKSGESISVHFYKINLSELNNLEEQLWDRSLQIFADALVHFLGIPSVPSFVLSYGRRYMAEDYFNTMGEFVDMVPLLMENSMEAIGEKIKYCLGFCNKHNLNFSNLIFNPAHFERWQEVVNAYMADEADDHYYSSLFNFQGFLSENDLQESERMARQIVDAGINSFSVCTIMCEVKYTSDTLQLVVYDRLSTVASAELQNSFTIALANSLSNLKEKLGAL